MIKDMKIALLLYGMFRHPDTAPFWSLMLPKGDLFICATFTPNPNTSRSHDGGLVYPNITFRGLKGAAAWLVMDQAYFDSQHGIEALIANKSNFFGSHDKSSVRNAVRVIFQLRMLRDMFLVHDANHTHAILTRVDVLFVRPIAAERFHNTVVVPDYADFGGRNDRFVAGPIKSILPLMDRLDVWRRTDALAERLMLATFRAHRIVPHRTAIGYNRRVRLSGKLHRPQYKLKSGCVLDTAETMKELFPYENASSSCFISP